MSLTSIERETVVTFNDEDGAAQVFTHQQRRVIAKLNKNRAANVLDEGFETAAWAIGGVPTRVRATGARQPSLVSSKRKYSPLASASVHDSAGDLT